MRFGLAALGCVAVVVAALFLTGAFSGPKPSTPERTFRGHLDALADGDGERACGYLTGMVLAGQGGLDCPGHVERAARGMSDEQKSALRQQAFRTESVRGDIAVIRVPGLCPKSAAGARFVLLDIHGIWKISGSPDGECAALIQGAL